MAARQAARRRRRQLVEHPVVGVVAPLVAVAIVLGAWQLTGHFVSPILISSPSQVARDFVSLWSQGAISAAIGISLRELYLGLAIGVVAGLLLGLLIGRYRLLDNVLSPFINAANATPLNILIPLMIIWVGLSAQARVLFIVLITMFPVLLNTAGGLKNVNRGYMEVGRTLGLSERQLLWKVAIPATTPYIFAGLRVGVSLSIIGMIVGEIEVSNVGLGYLLSQYGESYQTGRLLALIILAAILGVVNVSVLRGVQLRWFKWTRAAR
ncbi:MAG TPA: ABC transporter permease [Acidimicrobiales bacterium]|nr:ABC transporter permease [Acidimicrobiales bacterium]